MLLFQCIRPDRTGNTTEHRADHSSAHLVSQESTTGAADQCSSQSPIALLPTARVSLPIRTILTRLLVSLRRIAALWVSLLLLRVWAVAAVIVTLVLGRVLALRRVALGCATVGGLVVARLLLTVWSLVLWGIASLLLGRVLLLWRIALSLGRTAVGLLALVVAAAAASVVLVV